jgi:Putative DNA-binding domain
MATRPLPAFSQCAIRQISQPDLARKLADLHDEYPVSRTHRDLFQQLGSEFVYAAYLPGKARDRWLVLVRFGEVVEQRFGLSAEVPLIYDHHSDLQIRTVDSFPDSLKYLPPDRRSVSPELCFLSTPDPYMEEKAHRWSRPDRLLIALPWKPGLGAEELLDTLSSSVFSRDLYSVRGAVTGRDFFGRQRLMAAVLDDVHSTRVPGIFGMRKSGKTSLLKEMIRTSVASDLQAGRKRAFIYQDLEHLTGFDAGDPVTELVADLIESLRAGLKAVGLRTKEVAELPADASLPQLRSALDLLLSRLESDQEMVLVLDEVEYLCPPQAERQAGNQVNQKVPQLFGVFRKLVQERRNFGLVVAGLASASVEASELYGRPNPLFTFAKPYYLGPFSDSEGAHLLRSVGKQVGLAWSDGAIQLAMSETGGSAMLIRELGSAVLKSYPENRTATATVERANVAAILGAWRRAVSSNLREVVLHLQRFYPDESTLIGILMSSPADFSDLAYDFPDQVHRLHQLGVIEQVGDEWAASRILQMGWELADRKRLVGETAATPAPPASSVASQAHSSSTEDLICYGEGAQIEFKQTATYNSHTGSKDSKLELAIIKSVAGFLNADGGVLLIGVHDKGYPVGLTLDFGVCSPRKDRDGFENWLYTLLAEQIERPVVASFVKISFKAIDDSEICRVDIRRSPQPVYAGGNADFFVRMGNSTRTYNSRDAVAYIRTRWPNNQK